MTPSFTHTSCLSAFVIVPAALVVHKPPHLSFEQAAGLPIAFLTAAYALHELGRLRPGERVLIHAAAGGVGLAAVQLAQRAGAEIFATAGSPEKRAYLRELGIRHVMDSRSLTFADEIMATTAGRGVDIVLNSLAGEAIPKSLAVLGPRGRFLEIGKRDIYQNSAIGLEPFKKNLSFFAIDLARMVDESPSFVAELFRTTMRHFDDGTLQPLPTRVFSIGEAVGAFRSMAQAQHIGKIVLTLQDQQVLLTAPAAPTTPVIRPEATYLITGGLGALGLLVAQWMVQRGARHLVLVARSEPSPAAQATLLSLQQAGANVVVAQADVASHAQMERLLADSEQSLPPLKGIIHAAGILADAMVRDLDLERLQAAMAPKISGAWNLHMLTEGRSLDFFVLFSSIASLLGLPGQGNYAAANAFLDALAHHRRAGGLPALSINWGPWADVGLAAAQAQRGDRLAGRGIASLSPKQGLEELEELLATDLIQVGVMPFNVQQWCEFYPTAASPLLADLRDGPGQREQAGDQLREALLRVEPGKRRRAVLESYLREQLAPVLRLVPVRIDLHRPLKTLGLDSLMSLEFRNRLEARLGLTLPATLIWNYPTLALLADRLSELLGIPLEAAEQPETEVEAAEDMAEPAQADGARATLVELEHLSQDEVEALLNSELAAVQALLKER